jgi:hypothetical protein
VDKTGGRSFALYLVHDVLSRLVRERSMDSVSP